MPIKPKKNLCADNFIRILYQKFSKIPDHRTFKKPTKISLTDCIMSCFAIFSLKWSSLLKYEEEKTNPKTLKNLRNLYHVSTPPSDTYMRERLDELDPATLRMGFKKIFALLQRGKELEQYQYLNDYYLISIDGTGHFSSEQVSCANCCVKNHKDGRVTYYHHMLGASLVHPEKKVVIPFCPEPILKQDGKKKNDCERNASKRFLEALRKEHPHLKIMVVEDGLASNAPHILLLQSLSMRYIIGVKEGDHEFLFDWIKHGEPICYEKKEDTGIVHQYRFLNEVPLNDANFDLKVNFLEYTEVKKGKKKRFTWITNVKITEKNVYFLMRGGRSRWRIENETFNTLKNQGYNFKHNFGHGKNNLCTIMSFLMMLAFLVDQAQLLCCRLYQQAKQSSRTFYSLWEQMRVFFQHFVWKTWDQFLGSIAAKEILDSS